MARRAHGISAELCAGRAALSHSARAVPAARTDDVHVPQQDGSDSAADPFLGRFHAAERRRWWRRALERGNLALPAVRFRGEDAFDPALRRGIPAGRHDHPGLGRHLRRTGAALRRVRISLRHVGDGRQPARPDPGGRQSVRRTALAALSQSRAGATVQLHAVREGGARARLQAVSTAVGKHVEGLHQSTRHSPGAVHLLWLLRVVRMRQLFQGQSADDDPPCPDPQVELRRAGQFRGDAHQHRPLGQARYRRHLRRYLGRGMGATG